MTRGHRQKSLYDIIVKQDNKSSLDSTPMAHSTLCHPSSSNVLKLLTFCTALYTQNKLKMVAWMIYFWAILPLCNDPLKPCVYKLETIQKSTNIKVPNLLHAPTCCPKHKQNRKIWTHRNIISNTLYTDLFVILQYKSSI